MPDQDEKFLHDLRNHIGAAKMNTEMALRHAELPEPAKKNLDRVLANLNQILVMVMPAQSAASPAPEPREPHEATENDAPNPASSQAKSVLLIDDSADLRALFVAVLKPRGYNIQVAQDEAAALKILASGPSPDLILLDYSLGATTGSDVLDTFEKRGIRALTESKVILFTGYGDSVHDARAHGVEIKLTDLKSIIKIIEKYCR